MDNYTKGEVREVEDTTVIAAVHADALKMKVNSGSKIKNLMGFALKKMKESEVRQITWSGSGQAVTKVISCAEVMKRRLKGLHQVTDIRFKRVEEFWEPKVEGLERLKVNICIPAMTIVLSKDVLDSSLNGYQSGDSSAFWQSTTAKSNGAASHSKLDKKSSTLTAQVLEKKRKYHRKDAKPQSNSTPGEPGLTKKRNGTPGATDSSLKLQRDVMEVDCTTVAIDRTSHTDFKDAHT